MKLCRRGGILRTSRDSKKKKNMQPIQTDGILPNNMHAHTHKPTRARTHTHTHTHTHMLCHNIPMQCIMGKYICLYQTGKSGELKHLWGLYVHLVRV